MKEFGKAGAVCASLCDHGDRAMQELFVSFLVDGVYYSLL
jgi:hypothetical protein